MPFFTSPYMIHTSRFFLIKNVLTVNVLFFTFNFGGGDVTVGRPFGEGSERLDGFWTWGSGWVKNAEKIVDVLYVRPLYNIHHYVALLSNHFALLQALILPLLLEVAVYSNNQHSDSHGQDGV